MTLLQRLICLLPILFCIFIEFGDISNWFCTYSNNEYPFPSIVDVDKLNLLLYVSMLLMFTFVHKWRKNFFAPTIFAS